MGPGRRPNLHFPEQMFLQMPHVLGKIFWRFQVAVFAFLSLKTGFPHHPNVLARMSSAIWEVQLSCRWERHKPMHCQFLGHHTVREHTEAQRPVSTHARRPACSVISSCDFSTTEHKIKPSNLCCSISRNQLVFFFSNESIVWVQFLTSAKLSETWDILRASSLRNVSFHKSNKRLPFFRVVVSLTIQKQNVKMLNTP